MPIELKNFHFIYGVKLQWSLKNGVALALQISVHMSSAIMVGR